ncbi:MAG: flagellar protein FlgN [Desulfovibrionales bacterium]|nr:flagellar protein FlgN [Desulfovibrionales bacterium]
MRDILYNSLKRQSKGTELLTFMLEEEYSLLRGGQPDAVAGLEISIQELVRQLVREREFLQKILAQAGYPSLAEYLATQSEDEQECFITLRDYLVDQEQASARQSTVNADLAMALWEQSGQLLSTFSSRIAPKERNTYTAKGTWHDRSTTASLVSGRL